MKKLLIAGAVLMACLLASVNVTLAEEGWIDNVDEALKIAEKENKHVFLDFSGSDW